MKKYAAAIGMLLGGALGTAVGIPLTRVSHRRPYYDTDNGALDCVARQATILNVHFEHACGRHPRAPCQTAIIGVS